MRVLRLDVPAFNVYITNQFQSIFSWGGGGGRVKTRKYRGDCEEENFCPNYVPEFGLWVEGRPRRGNTIEEAQSFFAVVLFGSSPHPSVRFDQQTVPSTPREDVGRESTVSKPHSPR